MKLTQLKTDKYPRKSNPSIFLLPGNFQSLSIIPMKIFNVDTMEVVYISHQVELTDKEIKMIIGILRFSYNSCPIEPARTPNKP